MLERRQAVIYQWEGEIPLREMPTDVLYDVRLELRYDGGSPDAEAVAHALAPFGRAVVRRWPFVAPRVHVSGQRIRLSVRIVGDVLDVRLAQRAKGRTIGRLVEALAAFPGAADLTIQAASPHYDPAYSDLRPCTTCAARNFPPSGR